MKLALCHPTGEDAQWFRQFLLDYGHEVVAERPDYAALKELNATAADECRGSNGSVISSS